MANDNPLASLMSFTARADFSQAIGEIDKLNAKLKESEDNAKSLAQSLSSFEGAGASFAKNITGIFGQVASVIESVVLAPAKLDNFLGVMNQRITTVGNQLERYRTIITDIHAKTTGMVSGLSADERSKLVMGFAAGATFGEKYGPGAKGRAEGFAEGGAGLMRGLGFSAETASSLLTSLRKNVALASDDMGEFSMRMTAIGRTSNMTTDQLSKQIRSAIGLARAYGMAGKSGQEFVLQNLRVASAVSQMGLNVEDTMRKINEVATGSEEGLIQSLLMGFQPGDPSAQLGGFENMAQRVMGMVQGQDQRVQPYLIRQIGDQLGLKQFSVEDIQKLAQGVHVEGRKDPMVKATDLLQELVNITKNPAMAKERPFDTPENRLNRALSALTAFLEVKFRGVMNDLLAFADKFATNIIPKLEGWFKWVDDFFHVNTSKLSGLAGALTAALTGWWALKTAVGFLVSKTLSGLGSLAKWGWNKITGLGGAGGAGGAAGEAAAGRVAAGMVPSVLAALGTSVATASGAAIFATVAAGLIIGGGAGILINWVIDQFPSLKKAKDKFFDYVVDPVGNMKEDINRGLRGTPDDQNILNKPKSAMEIRRDLLRQEKEKKAPKLASSANKEENLYLDLIAPEIAKGIDIAKKEGFGNANFNTITGEHKEDSAHYWGGAFDVGTTGFNKDQIAKLKKKLEASGLQVIDESDAASLEEGKRKYGKEWSGQHLHAQLPLALRDDEKIAALGRRPSGSLMTVSDEISHKLLYSIDHGIRSLISKSGVMNNTTYGAESSGTEDRLINENFLAYNYASLSPEQRGER